MAKQVVDVPVQGDPDNEVCSCGALKAEHADKVKGKLGDTMLSERYAGACARTGCQEFTWAGFVKPPQRMGWKPKDTK